jgi:hypothetical protein
MNLLIEQEPRFRSKINHDGPTPAHCPELGPCHTWRGFLNADGYGTFHVTTHVKRPKQLGVLAHRVAWMVANRETLVTEQVVMHRCDNPACVRIDHLRIGTVIDNTRDKVGKRRHSFGSTHGTVTKPGCSARGTANAAAKLTEADVLEIRKLRAQRVKILDLAARFGVSGAAIKAAVSGKSWSHLKADAPLVPWSPR